MSSSAPLDPALSSLPVTPLVQVRVVPDAQDPQIIRNAISQARQYVWMEMYTLTDPDIISALAAASQRSAAQSAGGQTSIDVRVILEPQPFGFAPSPALTNPAATFGTSNVQVRPSPPSAVLALPQAPQVHFYNHAKLALIDEVAYVMSSNLSKSGTGDVSQWGAFQGDRDYIVMDRDPGDVQTLKALFTADWAGGNWNAAQQASASGQLLPTYLIVSPFNAHNVLLSLIQSARHSLLIECEQVSESSQEAGPSDIEQALLALAPHVSVQLIVPQETAGQLSPALKSALQVRVHDPTLYMHAKMMLIDGQSAYVGSQNLSAASLKHNREVGVILSAQQYPDAIARLSATFATDWAASQPPT
jgi:cardiolipin synthase